MFGIYKMFGTRVRLLKIAAFTNARRSVEFCRKIIHSVLELRVDKEKDAKVLGKKKAFIECPKSLSKPTL